MPKTIRHEEVASARQEVGYLWRTRLYLDMINMMTIFKPFFLFFLFVSILTLGNGCATLPNVSETIDEAPTTGDLLKSFRPKDAISPNREALMERLKRSVEATDMLERYTAVIESVSESPLTKGNKVTLLVNGPATYAAMFKAVQNATDHINIETFTMEDIEDERPQICRSVAAKTGGGCPGKSHLRQRRQLHHSRCIFSALA